MQKQKTILIAITTGLVVLVGISAYRLHERMEETRRWRVEGTDVLRALRARVPPDISREHCGRAMNIVTIAWSGVVAADQRIHPETLERSVQEFQSILDATDEGEEVVALHEVWDVMARLRPRRASYFENQLLIIETHLEDGRNTISNREKNVEETTEATRS